LEKFGNVGIEEAKERKGTWGGEEVPF